ncbi:hypothetical protein BJF95_19175 [Rhizobium oryziradicis]|uniref:Uncharacterized protein n=1 Tax=Rhizobium oryziradicis TaxID=1867956 RepID=A0A1Q8ZMD2_9HYPH|nr:hypothetical protein BJF95_19175 [Rhizobium oryziradicis]
MLLARRSNTDDQKQQLRAWLVSAPQSIWRETNHIETPSNGANASSTNPTFITANRCKMPWPSAFCDKKCA